MTHEQILVQMLNSKPTNEHAPQSNPHEMEMPILSDWISAKITQVKDNLSQVLH